MHTYLAQWGKCNFGTEPLVIQMAFRPWTIPLFVRLFTCCFIKSCTFVRLIWKGGQIRGIPNHNISPATSYLDTYLQTTKKENYNGKLHFGEQA